MAVWLQNPGEPDCTPEVIPDETCAGKARDDLCVVRGKKIRWRLYGAPNRTRFSLIFDADDPFAENCEFKSDGGDGTYTSRNKMIQCKIRDNDFTPDPDGYKYTVEITGCPNPLDPRIYIRDRNL